MGVLPLGRVFGADCAFGEAGSAGRYAKRRSRAEAGFVPEAEASLRPRPTCCYTVALGRWPGYAGLLSLVVEEDCWH